MLSEASVTVLTDGVKTAIVGFIFVCIVLPHIIKNRAQYYMALATVLVSMFFQLLIVLVGSEPYQGFGRVCMIMSHLLDMLAILLLVMAAGGLSVKDLAGDMARAYEVMRRGEQEKEIIIPLPEQLRSLRETVDREAAEDEGRTRYAIDEPAAQPPARPGEQKTGGEGSIPLE
jgi:hypothetical protein